MMTDYKRIAILLLDGQSRRKIATICTASSKTITKVKKYLEENTITKEDIEKLDNEKLTEAISPRKEYTTTKERPDYEAAHIAFMEGNPLVSSWDSYAAKCEASHTKRLSYTRFFELVKDYEQTLRATEDADQKHGELVIAKWFNRSVETADEDGVAGKAYVFMLYFPLSQYICLYGSLDKSADTTERFIIACFEGTGACPKSMMTDNCRCFYSNKGIWRPQLSHLSSHYGIEIVPAEHVSPQVLYEFTSLTKLIEKTVREDIYRSINDLNDYLSELQRIYVSENIRGNFTRATLFRDEVRFMTPVPQTRYEPFQEEAREILYNLHVFVDGTYYSVPYDAYIKSHFVRVRIYTVYIEIYQNNILVARHRKTSDRYCTNRSHMPPPDVLGTLPWNGKRLREWASHIGPQTRRVIDEIIRRHPIEQQSYTTCIIILKMRDKFGYLLEEACSHVDNTSVTHAYRFIKHYINSQNKAIKSENES